MILCKVLTGNCSNKCNKSGVIRLMIFPQKVLPAPNHSLEKFKKLWSKINKYNKSINENVIFSDENGE